MITKPRQPATATFELWGGRASVLVADDDALSTAEAVVCEVVAEFDLACSSHRADSELAAVNAAGGLRTAIGAVLFDALDAALDAARSTDGDVDPTVGMALVAHRLLPSGDIDGPISFQRVPGYKTVHLSSESRAVTVLGGVRLDLGATAKALAADRAAAAVYEQTGSGVLVNLLGDLAIAGPAPANGWRIRVTDDHRSPLNAPGQTVMLREGGLATSSTTVRRGSGGAHHVIDPRTGNPAAVYFQTVSVAANSCLEANIAATAAIVRGPRAVPWLERQGLPARLVQANGIVTRLGAWPADRDDQ